MSLGSLHSQGTLCLQRVAPAMKPRALCTFTGVEQYCDSGGRGLIQRVLVRASPGLYALKYFSCRADLIVSWTFRNLSLSLMSSAPLWGSSALTRNTIVVHKFSINQPYNRHLWGHSRLLLQFKAPLKHQDNSLFYFVKRLKLSLTCRFILKSNFRPDLHN